METAGRIVLVGQVPSQSSIRLFNYVFYWPPLGDANIFHPSERASRDFLIMEIHDRMALPKTF
jgi:hypothetical protein